VRAGEQQAEAAIGQLGRHFVVVDGQIAQDQQLLGRSIIEAPLTQRIGRLAARHREQPGLGCARHAVQRPVGERGSEGLRQRIFGTRDVVRSRGEKRDELAVAAPRCRLGSARRVRVVRRHEL